MSKEFATLLAALIGAISGSVIGPFIRDLVATRRVRTRRQERIAREYLSQLQDATASLYYRFYNLAHRDGSDRMDPSYREVSTLYAWACVVAYRRILRLDGVYSQLESIGMRKLAVNLREDFQNIDDDLKDDALQFYHRMTLAESVVVREGGKLRTTTFLEFLRQYSADSPFRDSLQPANAYLDRLRGSEEKKLSDVLTHLVEMEQHISEMTKEPAQLRRPQS